MYQEDDDFDDLPATSTLPNYSNKPAMTNDPHLDMKGLNAKIMCLETQIYALRRGQEELKEIMLEVLGVVKTLKYMDKK